MRPRREGNMGERSGSGGAGGCGFLRERRRRLGNKVDLMGGPLVLASGMGERKWAGGSVRVEPAQEEKGGGAGRGELGQAEIRERERESIFIF